MKKVLISLMLVLLTLCLVVSCNPAPKEGYTITLEGEVDGTLSVACKDTDTWESYFGTTGLEVTIGGTTYILKVHDGIDKYVFLCDSGNPYVCSFKYGDSDVSITDPISDYDGKTIVTYEALM